MAVKNAMTSEFLHAAYSGESMAHMRYLIWGDVAEKEGYPNVARLFRAVSYAEQVHATNHFREIDGNTADASVTAGGVFGMGKTADNLRGAINGELHEVGPRGVKPLEPELIGAANLEETLEGEKRIAP